MGWIFSGLSFAITDGTVSIFDWLLSLVYTLVSCNFGDMEAGRAVALKVYAINQNGMVPIGVALVNALILIHMIKASANLMEFKRPAVFIRAALRLIFADAVIINSYDLFQRAYNLFAGIIRTLYETAGLVSADEFTGLIRGDSTALTVDSLAGLIALMLSLVAFVAMIVTCFSVFLTVVGRFFKIYFYAMIAPVPLATLACEGPDRIGKAYLRSFLGVCMEGLVIAGASVIFAVYLQNGDFLSMNGGRNILTQAFSFLGDGGGQIVANQVGMLLNMSIFAGMIKGSDRIVREMMG